ncbi:PAS domain-containing protein [Emticicia sp. BO119]|uniref:PAS domain-containing sensor histidine kinase n=1 Tax=Emticicia sp. BO119 TaxID=2757768 RepID=UPI0015F07E39|nr:PAS domain-containing protein [Emticicia sp. BO119]MBA4849224.1 PAS domain-containing protein [Emticicia sp. BO119]
MSLTKDKSDEIRSVNEVIKPDLLHFNYLNGYAAHLLSNKLEDFTRELLFISREIKIPVLRFFEHMPEDELIKISIEGTRELLNYFATNTIDEFIETSIKKWTENQLVVVQSDEIVAKDISAGNFARRKAFRRFLPDYTTDFKLYNHILDEIDQFVLTVEEKSYNTLFNIKQQKINENLYFIEKVNNTLPGVVYVYDLLDQKEIYSTSKREELIGFTGEEIRSFGSNMFSALLHPEDLDKRLEHLRNFSSAKDGEIRSLEYRLKNKRGGYHWQRVYETVFKRNEQGIPSQIIGMSLDINKEKDASQKLQLREQQLSEAQEIAGLGSFEWDLQAHNSLYSDQLLKIFELEESKDYLTFLQFVHPADQTRLTAAINEAITGNGIYECEYRYQKETEKIIWSRGIVTFQDGKPLKMRGTVMDVTERNKILQQLEHTIELHKQAQALTHIGNWSWDIPNNKIDWSDEMYRIYGLEPQSEEIHFERFVSLVHPEDRERRISEIHKALETHIAEDYVIRIVWDNGTIRVLQGKGEVLLNEFNKPYKLTGTCQDVTEQYRINQQLEQKNIELQRSNEELTSFNYIASHDLQEPLRKIKLFSNRIFEKDFEKLTPTAKEFLPRIITSATQMQKLINDLLAFSRATSADKIFEKTNLNLLLDEVKNTLKDSIEEKNVIISHTTLSELNLIPFQFQQLLENIIGNAIKYSKTDVQAEINITSKTVQGKNYVSHGADAGKNYNMLSITDNGIGFDQQYSQKIFELFQRLHNKNEYSGTGIGLAICKKIIQNHQGFITANGEPGKGATFHIFTPLSR